jgi:RNA polymerase sigma-70 factor (ECF subfamily)
VRNLVFKRLRRADAELAAEERADTQPACGDDGPLPRLLAQELSCQVRKAISQMPPLQREVIVLFEYEGQSLAEIAAIVGIDIGAVKSRLHRAWLRREMALYMNSGQGMGREQANHE